MHALSLSLSINKIELNKIKADIPTLPNLKILLNWKRKLNIQSLKKNTSLIYTREIVNGQKKLYIYHW